MKASRLIAISACFLCCLFMSSCDVHEFPDPLKVYDYTLHLDYSTEMSLYTTVEYTESASRSNVEFEEYDVRYIVKVYDKETSSREVLYSFTFTKDDVSELDNSVTMSIVEGEYRFVVWTDYVEQGSEADLYYATDRFEYVTFAGSSYVGCNDRRDAFTGSVTATVSEESLESTVVMTRPMAKFNFITTDVEDFVSDDCVVVFRYNGFMPSAYNLHAGGNADTMAGIFFESRISQPSGSEAEIGFDYVFVNDYETVVNVYLEIYDTAGKLLSRSGIVRIPLMRSKLTTVRSRFLTAPAAGGVVLVPDYDGEYNIVVQ